MSIVETSEVTPEQVQRGLQALNGPKLAAILVSGNSPEWTITMLSLQLSPLYESYDVAAAVARSIVETYEKEQSITIYSDDGCPLHKLTAKDFWRPDALPRESGNTVMPLPRLRPEVEALLTQSKYDSALEQELKRRFLAVVDQDVRLTFLSRKNRKQSTHTIDKQVLIQQCLNYFSGQVVQADLAETDQEVQLKIQTQFSTVDFLTVNTRFDFTSYWTRTLARSLATTLSEKLDIPLGTTNDKQRQVLVQVMDIDIKSVEAASTFQVHGTVTLRIR